MVTLANRVKVTSATTGTADTVSLGSAITGFQTFSEASITDGAQVRYVIEDGANFEIGVGTFQSPATLVRSDAKVSESTSSNNKISLSGNASVFITASAEDIPQLKVLSTQTIDNPNSYGTSTSDEFGRAVAVSGNYTVVGAPKEDELLGGIPYDNTGRVYIFDTDSGSLLHTLQDTVSDQNTDFGISVDVSGKYAIVGAGGTDGTEGSESGRAYIFDVTTGTLTHTLNNPNAYNTATLDRFGDSVSISGKYAIVGAPGEDDASGLNSGKAYIYNVETGTLLYTLDNPSPYGTSQSDQFATSVSISGNYAIVGAPGEQGVSGGANAGHAYIYDISTFTTSTITSATYRLTNPSEFGSSEGDLYGTSVSISGNYAIVGAPDEDDADGNSSGKAYLYDISTFTGSLVLSATHVLDNPNVYGTSTNDQYGSSVSISGNYVVVGAIGEDESSGSDSGKVYLYDISTLDSYIVPVASYTIANPNGYNTPTTDNFGSSLAISGNRVVVGAYKEDDANGTSSGKAYSFKLSTGNYAYTADEISLLASSSSGGSTDYINSASFNTGTGVLSLTGEGDAGASVDLDGRYQLAGTYNTVIGTDTDIDTSGSTIIDNIFVTDGVITSMGTRTLTAGDIGAQPSGTYNTIIGTDTDIDTSGSTIIDNIYVTDGVITSMGTRTLTAGDIGALASSVSNQNLNTTNAVTFAGLNINGSIDDVGAIFLEDAIYHSGDTNTYMQFHNQDQWRVVAGGAERLEVNANNVVVNGSLVLSGDYISLGGTGRITGIDTVSSDTDAANKLYVDNAVAGAGGGGISNVVEDTSPQLGGELYLNGNAIRDAAIYFGDELGSPPHSYFDGLGKLSLGGGIDLGGNLDIGFNYVGIPNSNFSVQDFGTGGYFTISMFGGDIIQAYSSVGPSSQSVTINGNVDIRNFGNLQFNSVTSKVDRHISNGVIEDYDRYSSSQSSLSVSVQDNSTSNIQWISAALTSNVTLNITGITNPYNIPTSVNTISVMANVGSTGYIVDTVNVDGSNHTINWAGGSAPTPTTNAYNLFTFTIFWNNPAADIEIFGTHQGF